MDLRVFQRTFYWELLCGTETIGFFKKIFKQESKQVVGKYSLQRKAIYDNYYLGIF